MIEDNLEPPIEQEERDPDLWIFRGGHWFYIGDEEEV